MTPGPQNASAQDARFEEAPLSDKPLRLRAESEDDLAVISSLVQDAVGKAGDIAWLPKKRRLVALLNRFRWENGTAHPGTRLERVRSALSLESVQRVRARGLDPKAPGQVYDLLAILFTPGEDGAGTLTLTLAGGGEIAAEVECLDLSLADVTRPWPSRATRAPQHDR